MIRSGGRTVRIAHAYGNRRDRIEAAAAASVDFIEADIWYRAGDIWVRHERRMPFLPLLLDRRPRGMHNVGPWTLPVLPNYYARLDIDPPRLTELLERTRGRRGLLLDVKGDPAEEGARAYARSLARSLAEARCEGSVIVCGQTDVLDTIREVAPHLDVRYSIEKQWQWEKLPRRLDARPGLRGVCMNRKFLSDTVARTLEEAGLQVFCWTVDDPAEATRLLALGVDGIISNSLPLLEQLDEGG